MRKISFRQGCCYALLAFLWMAVFQCGARAQAAIKFSPKVMEVLNSSPVEIKDSDSELERLKKQRFNAALNEAKAKFDLYKRGLTRLPDMIEVGQRLFSAEVDLYDKPEDRVKVLQRHLDVYNEAEGNLEKQVKEGLATQADLERLRYNKASLEIELLMAKSGNSQPQPAATP
jgi:outer membrane protein TolC